MVTEQKEFKAHLLRQIPARIPSSGWPWCVERKNGSYLPDSGSKFFVNTEFILHHKQRQDLQLTVGVIIAGRSRE
jgi:hypothetical protein